MLRGMLSSSRSARIYVSDALAALADLASERRKVTVSHSNTIKVVKDIEDMQAKMQDSKKLKVAALNLCNKVRRLY